MPALWLQEMNDCFKADLWMHLSLTQDFQLLQFRIVVWKLSSTILVIIITAHQWNAASS